MDFQSYLGLLHVVGVLDSTPANSASMAGGSMKLKTSSDGFSVVERIFLVPWEVNPR